jgi:response regulator RpfG family c-di-GMP phosphodiesterase
MKIRVKMHHVKLPLIAATTSITGILSATSARAGMTRLALRLLNFKAEELAGYMRSQWDLLIENGFADDEVFVQAAQSNVSTFAASLIRGDSELVLAVDASGRLAMRTRIVDLGEDESQRLLTDSAEGWVDLPVGGDRYVGFAFHFAPFAWKTFVLEQRDSFLAEIRRITLRSSVVFVVAAAFGTALVMAFSLYLTRPLSRIVSAIEALRPTPPFVEKIAVEYPDEIGDLAHRFNLMTADLNTTYSRLREFAFREALARREIAAGERETLVVLAKAAEHRDRETAAHINRVGLYARLLAQSLGLDEDKQNLVYFASPLHDIGKLGVPDSILLKPGRLTPDEYEEMKRHAQVGYEVLKDAANPYLRAGAAIALTHHERYDGSGYPQGLVGDEIPMFGQIVGLVDMLDALTTRRPYKEAWDMQTTISFIESEKGRLFRAPLVDALLARIDEVIEIYEANRG